jgi:hypothetical protein
MTSHLCLHSFDSYIFVVHMMFGRDNKVAPWLDSTFNIEADVLFKLCEFGMRLK